MRTVYEVMTDLIEDERQTLRLISHFPFINQKRTRENIAALEIARASLNVEDAERRI